MRRSLDSADPNSLLRSPEWAHYKEDNEEFDSLTHDQDLLSRWAKKMHRLRGIFKLVCGWLTAVLLLCSVGGLWVQVVRVRVLAAVRSA